MKKTMYKAPATMYMNIESQVILAGSSPANIIGSGGSTGGVPSNPW